MQDLAKLATVKFFLHDEARCFIKIETIHKYVARAQKNGCCVRMRAIVKCLIPILETNLTSKTA
jgi:2-C-methyl-D-erythritol 4-phosphate cytidylyltransferase